MGFVTYWMYVRIFHFNIGRLKSQAKLEKVQKQLESLATSKAMPSIWCPFPSVACLTLKYCTTVQFWSNKIVHWLFNRREGWNTTDRWLVPDATMLEHNLFMCLKLFPQNTYQWCFLTTKPRMVHH